MSSFSLPRLFASKRFQSFFPLGFYFVFFLTLYSQFLFRNSFPFSCDGFLGVALAGALFNKISALFTGEFAGTFLYPVANPFAYGEFSLGGLLTLLFLKLIFHHDVLSYYVWFSSLYALTAYATYLLTKRLVKNSLAALFAGFAFTCSNFMFANNDDSIVFFYFLPFMSLYFMQIFLIKGDRKSLLWAAVLGGLQIYFSVQVFFYQTLLHFFFLMAGFPKLLRRHKYQLVWPGVIFYFLIPLPLILFFLNSVFRATPINVWGNSMIYILNIRDLIRPLPGSLLYPFLGGDLAAHGATWLTIKQHAFVGFLLPLLALLGLYRLNRIKILMLVLLVTGLFFSLGREIHWGGLTFISPIQWFYHLVPLSEYLRVTLRMYFWVSFALAVLSAYTVRWLVNHLPGRFKIHPGLCVAALMLIHSLENISYPLNYYDNTPYPRIPQGYLKYFKDQPTTALILDLPSNPISWPEYTEEALYMYYQTRHKKNIIGGVNGYYPPSRLVIHKYVAGLPSVGSLAYLKKLGLTHIVFHKYIKHPEFKKKEDILFFSYQLMSEWERVNKSLKNKQESYLGDLKFMEGYLKYKDSFGGVDFKNSGFNKRQRENYIFYMYLQTQNHKRAEAPALKYLVFPQDYIFTENYDWLENTPAFKKVYEDAQIQIYRII